MSKETIGRYEVESEVGRGGMASVYLAYDPRFRRKVAIKLVSVNLRENAVFRERFEREAQLIAKIEHPAIVPVYDFGEQDDQPYLVMRYMPGGALTDKIKEGTLSFRNAAQMISQIAPALDAVHAQGIVHRDLKPANILLDGFGNPAISDFGIAHFSLATIDLTGSAVIGTPAYMSPEQVRGERDIDGRSDIYALGVILFEMLTGGGPFRASTPLSVAMKHLTDSVPSIRSLRPDLPAGLDDIFNKALAKDRDVRFNTASEFAREIQALAAKEKGDPPPVPVKPIQNEDAATELYDVEDRQPTPFQSTIQENDRNPSPQSKVNPSAMLPTVSEDQSASDSKPPRRFPRNIVQIVILLAVGIFGFFLCGSIGVFGTWAGLSGIFSRPSPTSPPTPTAVVQETVFADDFVDMNSGWPTGTNARGEYTYRLDGYSIHANLPGELLWVATDRVNNNLSVTVDARPVSSSASGYHGLLCRIQEDQNYYYFVVNQNGEYTIGKYKNPDYISLLPEGWRQSDTIVQGGQTNRLRAECIGNTLRFYANDILLAEATDSEFTSGFSGMVAASLDAQGYEVFFDNYLITQPKP